MSLIYLDATTLIALGSVGELGLLSNFDGRLLILPAIQAEVTSQPAEANLERLLAEEAVATSDSAGDQAIERAQELLGDSEVTGDGRLLAGLLAELSADRSVGLVSDDRRLRTLSRGLGIPVTGTIGVVIRAVAAGLDAEAGKKLVRRLDSHGLHMTGELRDAAFDLIDDAAR